MECSRSLKVIRGPCTTECTVYSSDSLSDLSRQGPSLKCVEALVELLRLGNTKYHTVSMLPIQRTMERRPAQGSRVPTNTMLLSGISNNSHGGLDRRLAIERPV